ncbi:MAG TPA: patatin-like phospholipase family protein [Terriglobales bacterium]|nr:patatin-like phospholipase family protein [Terriglobales bacterium]
MADENSKFEYCDLVMKGGITSGVVYPLAVNQLRTRFLFKNIGGTSAGAIAASMAAAAEYGRRRGVQSSYEVLAALPAELGSDHLLLNLFQPATATVRIFRVALAALRSKSVFGRVCRAGASLLFHFWKWAAAGGLLGALLPLLVFAVVRGPLLAYLVLGSLWTLVGALVVLFIAAIKDAVDATVRNGFGFCSGYEADVPSGPPLTNWLHEKIQLAAGKDSSSPLTFGDLWGAPAIAGEPPMTGPTVKLQVVTSNLTLGRPYTLPFEADAFYFRESDMAALFPPAIVQHLKSKSHPEPQRRVVTREGERLLRLPDSADLPIVVAARMSLSFPILLSAVPLYRGDFPHKQKEGDVEIVTADCNWFSDGGICSNFPMHFFDSPLPRWPTFGIDLKPASAKDEFRDEQLVWLPPKPGSGSRLASNDFDQGSSTHRLLGFFAAIVDTMQNWRDNIQAIAAGYRDRIVHISLRPNEGGLNLNMPPELITSLGNRGRFAEIYCGINSISHLISLPATALPCVLCRGI